MLNRTLLPHAWPYREEGPNEDPIVEIHVGGEIDGPPVLRPNVYENDHTALLDAATPSRLIELKDFIKTRGGYYVVSPSGRLEQNGIERGEFDDLFGNPGSEYALVWIDVLPGYSRSEPLRLGRKTIEGIFILQEVFRFKKTDSKLG